MKMINVWILILAMGVAPASAYQKLCYVHPHYGRKGSLDDLKCVLGKHLCYNACKPNYEVCSADGRRTCHIRLNKIEFAHAKLFLNQCPCVGDAPIADDMVEGLLSSKKVNLKTVGLILRDFKYHNKHVTIQQVKDALGLAKK